MARPRDTWSLDELKMERTLLGYAYNHAADEVRDIAARMGTADKPLLREVQALQAAVAKVVAAYGRWHGLHCMVDPR
jgi:hypothetical protein